jgi:hypothetical protein
VRALPRRAGEDAIHVPGAVRPQQLFAGGQRGFDAVDGGVTVQIQRMQHGRQSRRTLGVTGTRIVQQAVGVGVELEHGVAPGGVVVGLIRGGGFAAALVLPQHLAVTAGTSQYAAEHKQQIG